MYADFAFYRDVYGGTAIAEADFAQYAKRAGAVLDMLTFGRIDGTFAAHEPVRLACCAVAETILQQEEAGGCVVREKVDTVERAYAAALVTPPDVALMKAARLYLWRTGLMSLAVRRWYAAV